MISDAPASTAWQRWHMGKGTTPRRLFVAIAANDVAVPPGDFSFELAALLREIGAALPGRSPSEPVGSEIEALVAALPAGLTAYFCTRSKADERRQQLAQRDRALQTIALEKYPNMSLRQAADEIATDVRRYAASQWRFDRWRSEVPPQYATNQLRALLFQAFKAGAGAVPGSPKQIERILKPLF